MLLAASVMAVIVLCLPFLLDGESAFEHSLRGFTLATLHGDHSEARTFVLECHPHLCQGPRSGAVIKPIIHYREIEGPSSQVLAELESAHVAARYVFQSNDGASAQAEGVSWRKCGDHQHQVKRVKLVTFSLRDGSSLTVSFFPCLYMTEIDGKWYASLAGQLTLFVSPRRTLSGRAGCLGGMTGRAECRSERTVTDGQPVQEWRAAPRESSGDANRKNTSQDQPTDDDSASDAPAPEDGD